MRRIFRPLPVATRERLSGQSELALESRLGSLRELRALTIDAGESLLSAILAQIPLVSVRLTKVILDGARETIASTGLRPQDAVLVSVATHAARTSEIDPHVATMDRDFQRVSGLHIWRLRD